MEWVVNGIELLLNHGLSVELLLCAAYIWWINRQKHQMHLAFQALLEQSIEAQTKLSYLIERELKRMREKSPFG